MSHISHLQPPALHLLDHLSFCSSFHMFGCQQDGPPLLLRVSDSFLGVDFPALVCTWMVTQILAPPPQVVHQTVAFRFGAQDVLQVKIKLGVVIWKQCFGALTRLQ